MSSHTSDSIRNSRRRQIVYCLKVFWFSEDIENEKVVPGCVLRFSMYRSMPAGDIREDKAFFLRQGEDTTSLVLTTITTGGKTHIPYRYISYPHYIIYYNYTTLYVCISITIEHNIAIIIHIENMQNCLR